MSELQNELMDVITEACKNCPPVEKVSCKLYNDAQDYKIGYPVLNYAVKYYPVEKKQLRLNALLDPMAYDACYKTIEYFKTREEAENFVKNQPPVEKI